MFVQLMPGAVFILAKNTAREGCKIRSDAVQRREKHRNVLRGLWGDVNVSIARAGTPGLRAIKIAA